jgi:hypothetical protein
MVRFIMSLLLSASLALAGTIVFGVHDDSDGCTPATCGAFPFASLEYQQVYSASAFLAQSDGAFRIDAIELAGIFQNASVNLTISLSTTARAVGALDSSDLASNLGPDNAVFLNYSGPVGPVFTGTPFYYDPAMGNLLMDIVVNSFSVGTKPSVHVWEDKDSGVMSRAANMGGSGFSDLEGMVTTFEGETVPEPSSILLLTGALLAALALRRKRLA